MNKKDLCNSFSQIDDDILERSEAPVRGQGKRMWLKWGAAAACLVLCLSAVAAYSRLGGTGDEDVQPVGTETQPTETQPPESQPGGPSNVRAVKTSDTYASLPELLAYLSGHDGHGDARKDGVEGTAVDGSISCAQGGDAQLEQLELVENTNVAVSVTGEYSYHIGESAVYISRLDGADSKNVGRIDVRADGIFVCNNHLLVVSRRAEGDDLMNQEMSACVGIYDITEPQNPVLQDEYIQGGELAACWMSGANLYLVTSDGVCACGWSRLDDPAGYYPSLSRNGNPEEWGDEDISILGEPTVVKYAAVTAINGNSREVTEKEALYGNITNLFYGAGWMAVDVAGWTAEFSENPVVYTFGQKLECTGKINTAQIVGAPEKNELQDYTPQAGDYLEIASVTRQDGIYRMLGSRAVQRSEEDTDWYFMAIAANAETGEAGSGMLKAENCPGGMYTEILWEKNRALACVTTEQMQTKFLFAEFQGLEAVFHENELTADALHGRVWEYYGNPLGQFRTLIPMGDGIYVRYTDNGEGPGGFDVYDFSDSAAPLCLYRAKDSLSGSDVFDYIWYVYDENTFGTAKVMLGEGGSARNAGLAWCVYALDPSEETVIVPRQEYRLSREMQGYVGGDAGVVVFRAKDAVYYVTDKTESVELLPNSF